MPQNTSPKIILSDIETAKTTFTKAKDFLVQKNYEQAIPLLKKVIEVFEAREEWELFMEASHTLVVAYREDFLFSELEEVSDYTLKIQEEKCPHLFLWKVRLYQQKGSGLYDEGKFKESIQAFSKAQNLIEREQIGGHLLPRILLYQVRLYSMISNYQKAEELLNTVYELLEKEKDVADDLMAEFYFIKGRLEYVLSKHELAHQSLQKSYELYSPKHIKDKVECYLFIVKIQPVKQGTKEKITEYLELFDVYKKTKNKQDKFFLARIYNECGRYNNRIGEFTKALYYYENALTIFEEVNSKIYHLKFDILLAMAVVFNQQRAFLKEIDCYKEILNVCKIMNYEKNLYVGIIYFNLANAYININSLDEALKTAQKASTIYRAILDRNHDYVIDGDYLIGRIYTKKREHLKGLQYLNNVLKAYQEKYKGNYYHNSKHRIIAELHSHIATNLHQQGKLEAALEHHQLTLTALLPSYEETDFYHLPTLEQCPFTEFDYLCELLYEKAVVLHDYFYVLKQEYPTKAMSTLKASFDTCILMVAYIHKIQKTFKETDSKLFIVSVHGAYQLSIKIILLLSNHLKDASLTFQAFGVHEQAKMLLLRSSMQENKAKIQAGIDSDSLEREKDLRGHIEILLRNIEQEEAKGNQKNKTRLKDWKQEYLDCFEDHQRLIEQFEKDYPQYYQLKYNFKTISVNVLQKDLEENTVVLSYFIGPEIGYIFVVTPDEYQIIPFEVPADFDQQIKGYLSSIHAQNWMDFTYQSYDLYCLLVKPIEDLIFDPFAQELRQLVILPSAALHYLPFETLIQRAAKTTTPAFHQLDYLLNRFEIQYHYSATLYHQFLTQKRGNAVTVNKAPKKHSIDFMGFAPIYTSDKEATQEVLRNLASDYSRWATRSEALQEGTLAPLPFSEKEVQSIEGLFAQKGLNGQSFLYGTATKDHFKTLASNAKYLHIAAHGLTNDEFPKLSGIVFHPTENATEIHDSVLSMGEMYQLQLQADLVVLSSCESGIGKLAKGEGMMAMNRSFLYAGAKNVIYTLFKVLDKPSSELCEVLFEGILEGKSYGEALRQAKLALIQREDVDPKSWAGFVLLGV